MLALRASSVNRGNCDRRSVLSNFVEASIFPVKNPCPSGSREQSRSLIPASWQHLWFRVSRPYRIFALDCGYWLNRVCATNSVRTGLRKAEVLDLAGLNQFFHCACDILDWHIWIDTVLIEKINDVGLETFELLFGTCLICSGRLLSHRAAAIG